ncbi:hypothetical protein EMCRGX_G017431 [Ephydatia muelleri]
MAEMHAPLLLEGPEPGTAKQYGTMEDKETSMSHNNSERSEEAVIIDTQELLDDHRQQLLDVLDNARSLVEKWPLGMVKEEKKDTTRKRLITNMVTSNIVVITLVWQALSVGCLAVIDFMSDHNYSKKDLAAILVMAAFQMLQLVLVFFISFKLLRQVLSHKASPSLLTQTYLSIVFMFAGLYTLEYQIEGQTWNNVSPGYLHPALVYLRLLYFSVSTATLCGASSVEPLAWYGSLTASLQMLTSFVYFPTILTMAMKYLKFGSKKTIATCFEVLTETLPNVSKGEGSITMTIR